MSHPKDIVIRPAQEVDIDAVNHIRHRLWQHDPVMLLSYDWHRVWPPASGLIRKTLIATHQETICGAGTVFESTFHPLRLYLVINVASEWQRRGVGSALFHALASLGDGRGWLVKATLRDTAGCGFLSKHGFRPIMRSRMGLIDPRDHATQAWLSNFPKDVDGFHFQRWQSADSKTLIDAARVHAAVYRRYHSYNPPIEVSDERALELYCGPTVFKDSHLFVYKEGVMVGAANLFREAAHQAADECYLVNVGANTAQAAITCDLTAALIRRSIEWAGAQGTNVRFEVDDAYIPHCEIFESAPALEIDRDFVLMARDALQSA
jgi:GNAT superfamily N-acetyltransferase